MQLFKLTLRFIFITMIFVYYNLDISAQKNKRISYQFAPIYSYLDIEFGGGAYTDLQGVKEPKWGFTNDLKLEIDLNKIFSFNSGISFERRNNSYETGIIYDTAIVIWVGEPGPYKFTSARTFDFVGIPLGLSINYFKGLKFRIYQTFRTQTSFLLSAKSKGTKYYPDNVIISYDNNDNIQDKNDVIFSFASSIGVSKTIYGNMEIKFESGFNYMINNFIKGDYSKEKFLDLKIGIGIVYNL